ncbi:dioxygenase family protein [Sporosarcina ureae]|uniref:dioxygenase family protein n=1 Tax=Sporosarcina ureae TaxID=1571 RepID=UPI0028ABC5E5|nr:dioxygenase [Sporosarcina ureae]
MNERLNAITSRVMEHLHDVIAEFKVTEDELRSALDFLTAVGKSEEYPLLSDVLLVSVAVDNVTHWAEQDGNSTASNVEGPLYRDEAPILIAPVNICSVEGAEDDILFVSGQVVSSEDGSPLANAVLDVWQANGEGDYENEDPNQPDYNLRGRMLTDENGRYEFRSVVPAAYEIGKGGPVGEFLKTIGRHAWRPAHIHFKLAQEGFNSVTTMLFIEDDPYIDDDAIGAVKSSLILQLEKCADPDEMAKRGVERPFYTAEYDFKLRPETTGEARSKENSTDFVASK